MFFIVIIIGIVLLFPLLAISKLIAHESGLSMGIILWYGMWSLIAGACFFIDGIDTALNAFVLGIAIHLGLKTIIQVLKWSAEVLN